MRWIMEHVGSMVYVLDEYHLSGVASKDVLLDADIVKLDWVLCEKSAELGL